MGLMFIGSQRFIDFKMWVPRKKVWETLLYRTFSSKSVTLFVVHFADLLHSQTAMLHTAWKVILEKA